MFTVATPDQCAVDLVSYPSWAGGLSNVATALAELPGLSGVKLAEIAAIQPVPVAQRLGWLLEFVDADVDLEPLRLVASRRSRSALLDPSRPVQGNSDSRWAIFRNADIEVD